MHESLSSVEWTTLFFFAGLFIMVRGVEHTGLLQEISHWITGTTDDIFYLSLIVLWMTGVISMIIDNIPFVTVMIPVILGIQAHLGPDIDSTVLWWALSLGACLGGNGTLVGASANVVSAGLAKKEGVEITFLGHLKFGLPITFGFLLISSAYLFLRFY
ncbi:sodium:proton antiporter [Candidatus Peregrinibacteria bacterium]|nr:sodium:proton antiporter [Candidatus Peregrinibacteria bacterium]